MMKCHFWSSSSSEEDFIIGMSEAQKTLSEVLHGKRVDRLVEMLGREGVRGPTESQCSTVGCAGHLMTLDSDFLFENLCNELSQES